MPANSLAPLRGNFVMLRAGDLRLLLPQAEVGAAGYLDTRPVPGDAPGFLRSIAPDDDRCFAALSAQMTLLPQCPPERFVVANIGDSGVAWCWDELRVLIDVQLQPHALPAVLVAPHTPVRQYAEHDGEIAFLCEAGKLAGFALANGS